MQLIPPVVHRILLDSHDGGIVDDDVDLVDAGVAQDVPGSPADRILAGELAEDQPGVDVGVEGPDLLDHGVDLGLVPRQEDEPGWGVAGEGGGYLGA